MGYQKISSEMFPGHLLK